MSTEESTEQQEHGMGPLQAEEAPRRTASSAAAASRWRLLRRFLLTSAKGSATAAADGDGDDAQLTELSRRPAGRYNLVPLQVKNVDERDGDKQEGSSQETGLVCLDGSDVLVEYFLPMLDKRIKLTIRQRREGSLKLRDVAACGKNSIDSTGIVCLWPAEEVLTYFCARHPELFINKTVIELGSGYGLGGLAIAACTEAAEVVITDGNPQVVEYIKHNIIANSSAFGDTIMSGSALYWSRDQTPLAGRTFDLVVAADCTFFKDFHVDLACTIKSLLGNPNTKSRQAILFNPRRGNTLDMFVHIAKSHGLIVEMKEHYDAEVWDIHQRFLNGYQTGWRNYDGNHCYPIFLSLRSSIGTQGDVTN
ncbi:unnamed protein product [Calypogeia fissa]